MRGACGFFLEEVWAVAQSSILFNSVLFNGIPIATFPAFKTIGLLGHRGLGRSSLFFAAGSRSGCRCSSRWELGLDGTGCEINERCLVKFATREAG